jgi:hypothetical protein
VEDRPERPDHVARATQADTQWQVSNYGRRRAIVEKGLNDLQYSGKTREDVAGDVFGELIAHAIETGDGIISE